MSEQEKKELMKEAIDKGVVSFDFRLENGVNPVLDIAVDFNKDGEPSIKNRIELVSLEIADEIKSKFFS